MSSMIQIGNVPDAVHRRLKARAALEGVSMSEFILREIQRALDRPSRSELIRRIAERGETYLARPAADLLRDERNRR
jgi:plasmid stability protein